MGWLLGNHWRQVSEVLTLELSRVKGQCNPHEICTCSEESLPVTVSVVVGDIEDSLLTKLHLDNTLIPSLDDAALANGGNKVTTSNRGIESG